MAKVKDIKEYKTIEDGYTSIKVPVSDDESHVIMELNFNHYVNILSEVLVKYSSNFKVGQMGVMTPSAMKTLVDYAICLIYIIRMKRKVSLIERWKSK